MKPLILLTLLMATATANADPRWWRDGGYHQEPFEYHFKIEKHKKKHKQAHKQKHHGSHGKHNSYGKNYDHGYDSGYHKGYEDGRNGHGYDDYHDYKPRRWQPVSGFRGRTGRDVTREIHVKDRVRALSIEGTKRDMVIREAYALMGNGRWKRLHGLEGYLRCGERVKHRLRNPRFVQRIVLEVEPARYKRGYAKLFVKPA